VEVTYNFRGRVALVTGGASGIGAAIAHRLGTSGATVACFDLQTGGDAALRIMGDIGDSEQVESAVTRVEHELGRLDILVSAAGISGEILRTTEVSDAEWRRVMRVNADGTFYACRAVLPGMTRRRYGRIVLIASYAGKAPNAWDQAYSASKAAVIAFTKSIALDVASEGVVINCVNPGPIETPMQSDLSDDLRDLIVGRIPLGRMGTPEEVASLVCWLASDECSFSTGAGFDVSGGRAVY
jgi:3-oxoacyl-[acyl-carrier protein] reductase